MFYLVELRQAGGCDYTINCGTETVRLDMEDARTEVAELLDDEYSHIALSNVTIYEVTCSSIFDYKAYQKERKDKERAVLLKAREDAERAEFERLQKKFGS